MISRQSVYEGMLISFLRALSTIVSWHSCTQFVMRLETDAYLRSVLLIQCINILVFWAHKTNYAPKIANIDTTC